MQRRLFLVPRWGGSARGDFYVQLEEVAKSAGFQLVALVPPKGLNPPDLQDTFSFLEKELLDVTDTDVLMGHSVGCQLLLRFFSRPETVVRARPRLVCVAGWIAVDKSWGTLGPFLKDDADWHLVKRHVRGITLVISDNDRFTADYRANIAAWEKRFGSSFVASVIVPGKDHFDAARADELCVIITRLLTQPLSLWEPLSFPNGSRMAHRVALSPLTNCQSNDDGTLAEEELHWLSMRASGGFALTTTTATFVHGSGKAFPGQLGISGDEHLPGLKRLAKEIQSHNSLAVVQLHHGGSRSEFTIGNVQRVAATAETETNTRALSTSEVHDMIEWFVRAAERAKEAGYDRFVIILFFSFLFC
jgi:predicted alpha/beta hydrolase family esterase